MPNRQAYQRQMQVTFVRGEEAGPTIYNYFPPLSSITLGAIQVFCGVVLLALSIASLITVYSIPLFTQGLDEAVWAIIAGVFAIAAGRSKTACKIATTLVLSILATLSSVSAILLAIVVIRHLNAEQIVDNNVYVKRYYAINVAAAVVAAIETLAALVSSIISCHFVCFCCKNCCCEFDVTKTQQLALLNDESATELRQVLTIPSTTLRQIYRSVTTQHRQQHTLTRQLKITSRLQGTNWLPNSDGRLMCCFLYIRCVYTRDVVSVSTSRSRDGLETYLGSRLGLGSFSLAHK